MEYTDSLRDANNQFWLLLTEGAILNKVALSLLLCAALILFSFALYKKIKRRWESSYFVLLCVMVLVWAASSLLVLFVPDSADMYSLLQFAGLVPIPALLCLHVRQQVSYKEQRPILIILLLFVPVFLMYMILRDLFFPLLMPILPAISEAKWPFSLFGFYAACALIRSYMLCFSVFYQMPRRTRRSTRYMLVGVSTVSLLLLSDVLWDSQLFASIPQHDVLAIFLPLFAPIFLLITLYSLFNALYVMPASEVIVTSREFVVGGLSTTILILNRKEEILDWNRTDWEGDYPLLKPLFKEPISVYRRRMLGQNTCRVSPHSDDIIIAKQGNIEKHFLLRNHEAKNSKRLFGYVLEISEVTQLYTLMRYYEQIARYDQLTGLFNRNAYMHRVETELNEEKLPLLILVGDINMLKRINDMHGHMLGDQLLSAVADIIKKAMPENTFAARVGGDEFVLLVPNGNTEMAERFIQKTKALCNEIRHETFGAPSISWGYAVMTSTDQLYNDVFSEADTMMYEDKKSHHRSSSSGFMPGTPDNNSQ